MLEDSFIKHFETSFNTLFKGLRRYAFSILKNTEDANDIVNIVFAKWWENKKRLTEDEVKSYLFTAVYRQCLNAIRDKNVKARRIADYSYMQNQEYKHEDRLVFEGLDTKIKEVVNNLPSQCRIIFCKSRFEGKRYIEIAAEMGLSIKTVEAQMGKALKILRVEIQKYES